MGSKPVGSAGRSILAAAALTAMTFSSGAVTEGKASPPEAFHELIQLSLKEKVGLTFFLNGQTLPAVVTKIIDERTVEGRSQQYSRIVIRLGRVNAIAKH